VNSVIFIDCIIVSASDDNSLRFWEMNGEAFKEISTFGMVTSLVYVKEMGKIVSGDDSGIIQFWLIEGQNPVFKLFHEKSTVSHLEHVSLHIYASHFNGTVLVLDLVTHQVLKTFKFFTGLNQIKFCRFSSELLLAGRSGLVGYLNLAKAEESSSIFPGHIGTIHLSAWVEPGSVIFTADCLGNIFLWNVKEKTLIEKVTQNNGKITDISFDSSSLLLGYCSDAPAISVWDLKRFTHTFVLSCPKVPSKIFYFCKDYMIFVTHENHVFFCCFSKCKFVVMMESPGKICSFSVKSKYLVISLQEISYILKFNDLKCPCPSSG
jgi:WD40 repeat protein